MKTAGILWLILTVIVTPFVCFVCGVQVGEANKSAEPFDAMWPFAVFYLFYVFFYATACTVGFLSNLDRMQSLQSDQPDQAT